MHIYMHMYAQFSVTDLTVHMENPSDSASPHDVYKKVRVRPWYIWACFLCMYVCMECLNMDSLSDTFPPPYVRVRDICLYFGNFGIRKRPHHGVCMQTYMYTKSKRCTICWTSVCLQTNTHWIHQHQCLHECMKLSQLKPSTAFEAHHLSFWKETFVYTWISQISTCRPEHMHIAYIYTYTQVAQKYLVSQPLDFDRFLCGFSHIFAGGYAAGYFSYKVPA